MTTEWASCVKCGLTFHREHNQKWRKKCITCWLKEKEKEKKTSENPHNSPPKQILTKEKVEKLIRLCHPDKHDNSPASNEITAWLLEQRNQ